MEIYDINPMYRSLLMEQSQQTSIIKENRENNWKRAILAVSVIGILLAATGIPIYGMISALESNALPYEIGDFGQSAQTQVSPSVMGNILWYELTHFGGTPTVSDVGNMLENAFGTMGLTFLIPYMAAFMIGIEYAFAVGLSVNSLIAGLELSAAIAAVTIDPVTLTALATAVMAA